MKKQLFIAVAIFLLFKTQAQTWFVIPDTNFANYLHTIVPTAMQHDSLDTSNPLVTTTTHSINVYNKNISDLNGVQYFTSLTYLNCGGNPITNLPALSNNLTYLNCSSTFLPNLPILPSSLVHLYCQSNSFTSLPALPNSLTLLCCNTNSLTTLPALPSSLDTLICGENKLTNLPVLPSSLIDLWCGTNSLTTLPALPNLLAYLDCSYNNLTNLPTLPVSLTYLECALNSLSNLPILPNSLVVLDCDNNSLTTLPALPNSLRQLYCYRNSLTGLPVLPDSITNLNCEYNQVECFPFIPNTIPVSALHIDFNPFNCLPNYTKAMSSDTITYPLCAAGNTHGCAVAGINEIVNTNNQIKMYPNPSTGNFIIETDSEEKQIVNIYDVSGRVVLVKDIYGNTPFNLSSFPTGVYSVSIISSTHVFNTRMLLNN